MSNSISFKFLQNSLRTTSVGLVNIDINLLQTLIIVSDTGSFTKAGERLLRSQTAISLQVKRLEEFVRERLVHRDNEMKLTTAGEMVRSYAFDIVKLNDQLVSTLETVANNRVVKIGTPDDYAQLFLPSVILEYSKPIFPK